MTVRELITALLEIDLDLPVEVYTSHQAFDSEPAFDVYQYSDRFVIGSYHDHVVIEGKPAEPHA